jgi:hypothetical protein
VSLRSALVSRAVGGTVEDRDYRKLRRLALEDEVIAARLPTFVRTCRDINPVLGLHSARSALLFTAVLLDYVRAQLEI